MSLLFKNNEFYTIKFTENYLIKNRIFIKNWNDIFINQILSEKFINKYRYKITTEMFIILDMSQYLSEDFVKKTFYKFTNKHNFSEEFIKEYNNIYNIDIYHTISYYTLSKDFIKDIINRYLYLVEEEMNYHKEHIWCDNCYSKDFLDEIYDVFSSLFINQKLSSEEINYYFNLLMNNKYLEKFRKRIIVSEIFKNQIISYPVFKNIISRVKISNNDKLILICKYQKLFPKIKDNYKDDITIEHKKLIFHYQKEE